MPQLVLIVLLWIIIALLLFMFRYPAVRGRKHPDFRLLANHSRFSPPNMGEERIWKQGHPTVGKKQNIGVNITHYRMYLEELGVWHWSHFTSRPSFVHVAQSLHIDTKVEWHDSHPRTLSNMHQTGRTKFASLPHHSILVPQSLFTMATT